MKRFLAVAVLLIGAAGAVPADAAEGVGVGARVRVRLFTGETVEGVLRAWTAESVRVETLTGERLVKTEYVQSVHPAAAAGDAAPRSSDADWLDDGPAPAPVQKTRPASTGPRVLVKLGGDYGGNHRVRGPGGTQGDGTTAGLTLAGEVLPIHSDRLFLGVGAAYQLPRGFREYDGTFNFIPLYGVMQLSLRPADAEVAPVLVGHAGYNFLQGDSDYTGIADTGGGAYWALGGALAIDGGMWFEVLYSVNNGVLRVPWGFQTVDLDVSYTKIGLSVGYAFGGRKARGGPY